MRNSEEVLTLQRCCKKYGEKANKVQFRIIDGGMEPMRTKIKEDHQWMNVLLILSQIAFFAAAVLFQSFYLIGCGGIMLWLGGFRILAKKRNGAWNAVFLLLPAIILGGLSVVPMLHLWNPPLFDLLQTGIFCVLIAIQAACIIFLMITKHSEKAVSTWVGRHFEFALLAVLLSGLVSQLLLLGNLEEWAQMVCLTGCVMGGSILLLVCNLLICSLCGRLDTRESIQIIRNELHSRQRVLHFVSIGKDGFMMLVKLGMSIISSSFFMFANALFSCGIGLARYTALKIQGQNMAAQLRLYRRVSAILSVSGLCYIGYSVRLFFGGSASQYSEVMALAIATYTFVEFGIQISELLKLRKHCDLEAEALRLVSFSGICISFVLTQTAIMSFSESVEHAFSDGLAGVVFGGLVVLIGVIMLLRYLIFRKHVKVTEDSDESNSNERY